VYKELAGDLRLLLWRAARASSYQYRMRVADLGLAPRQATALLTLVEHPGITLGALAEALGADQATTSAMVDRLMSAGLVRRDTDPTDRRRAMLQPTAGAQQLAEQLQVAREQTKRLLIEALGHERAKTLQVLLEDLITALGAEPSPALVTGVEH
jgi:DNA-binding MarR family transcriptional regulator